MKQTQPDIADIFRLALDGKKDQAVKAIKAERQRLVKSKESHLRGISSDENDISLLDKILPAEENSSSISNITDAIPKENPIQAADDKNKRDSAIIETAKRMGKEKDRFMSSEIAEQLKSDGIPLLVDDSRANTVISRLLLRHDKDFEKVDTGIFRYTGVSNEG